MIKRILFFNMLYVLSFYFYMAYANATEDLINEHEVSSLSENKEIAVFILNKSISKIEDSKYHICCRYIKKIKNCSDRTIFYFGCAISGAIFISLYLYILQINNYISKLNKKV